VEKKKICDPAGNWSCADCTRQWPVTALSRCVSHKIMEVNIQNVPHTKINQNLWPKILCI
jgi:hypothetical protein